MDDLHFQVASVEDLPRQERMVTKHAVCFKLIKVEIVEHHLAFFVTMIRPMKAACKLPKRGSLLQVRLASTKPPSALKAPPEDQSSGQNKENPPKPLAETAKTQTQADSELRQKLEAISGGGGEAGLELENGEPVAMKRGVKENMFRLI